MSGNRMFYEVHLGVDDVALYLSTAKPREPGRRLSIDDDTAALILI